MNDTQGKIAKVRQGVVNATPRRKVAILAEKGHFSAERLQWRKF
ncbi:hypothetical protein BH10PAT3_BH10PAT3_4080 [soil metagenome]